MVVAPAADANATHAEGGAAEATLHLGPAAASSFLELSLDGEPLSEADAAKKLAGVANRLYEQVIANVQVTRADLEVERGIFGAFRDKLRAMILKREAKLAKLKAQLTALNKAIAAGGSFAGDVWPLLKAHLKVVQIIVEMMLPQDFKTKLPTKP